MEPGFHLVHKPRGETSFSRVRAAMERIAAAGLRQPVCHGGALDPFADGLLLLLVGQATRLAPFLPLTSKEYEATVEWGSETDNLDPTGTVVASGDPSVLTPRGLDETLAGFLGERDQVPPAHSNKRVGGVRAWQLARAGETVDLPPSRLFLHEARFLSHDLPRRSTLFLRTGSGYYVRSLARDLGLTLGCRAHLSALRRTAIGPYRCPPPGSEDIVKGRDLAPWLPSRALSAEEVEDLREGRPIPRGGIEAPEFRLDGFPEPTEPVRAIAADRLVALLRPEGDQLLPIANLRGGL